VHNEEFPDLYRSPSVVRVVKSRRLDSVVYVPRTWKAARNTYRILVGKPVIKLYL
jgi:hypothetical protein